MRYCSAPGREEPAAPECTERQPNPIRFSRSFERYLSTEFIRFHRAPSAIADALDGRDPLPRMLLPVNRGVNYLRKYLQVRKSIRCRIAHHVLRVAAVLDVIDGVQQQLARGNDRFVRGNQMLRRAVLNRTLALGGKRVMRLKVVTHARKRLGFH